MHSGSITKEHQEFIASKRAEIFTELEEYLREVGHDFTADEIIAEYR